MKKIDPILVADDTPLQATMLRRILEQAGYDVVTLKNGAEALEYLKKQPFSLVVTDVNMPLVNGFELCKAIKSDPSLSHIPVIICSVLSDPQDLIMGLEAGAENYLTKPPNEKTFLKLVKDLMKPFPLHPKSLEPEQVSFGGKKYSLTVSRQSILNFLLSTYEHVHKQNIELNVLREEIQKTYSQVNYAKVEQEQLLLNIFPERVAEELLAYGSVNPARYDEVTVGFIDLVGFTESSSKLEPAKIVEVLEFYFENFDRFIEMRDLERIKTIGDGYMFAGGISQQDDLHAFHAVIACLEIRDFLKQVSSQMQQKYGIEWKARFGIHSGPIIAGVIGKKRLAYDIWGETVNLASRLQVYSEADKINISNITYQKIKDLFICLPHGTLPLRRGPGKETSLEMYYVERLK